MWCEIYWFLVWGLRDGGGWCCFSEVEFGAGVWLGAEVGSEVGVIVAGIGLGGGQWTGWVFRGARRGGRVSFGGELWTTWAKED